MRLLRIDWSFVLLILIVTIIQFSLLRIILQNGFTQEDWWILFEYKTIGQGLAFLEKYILTLQTTGLYHTYHIMYLGTLESLFKGNYIAYQATGIAVKILATISLYPLILIVFKKRLLAFLTTTLYAISYSSTGALYFICLGSDYLAIFFMNIFLLSYYMYFVLRKKIIFFISALLLFISFMLSPIRMYPLLALVVLIELFVWIKSKKLMGFIPSLARIILLFLPFFIILYFFPNSTGGQLNGISLLYQLITFGNYQILLTPFAGLGYTFLTNDYWSVFGSVNLDSFKNYFQFLLGGPVIIYSILAILLGVLLAKKKLRFILTVISVNLLFEIISYFLITHINGVVGPDVKGFSLVSTYAIFFGFFILSIAVSSLFVWLNSQRANILLATLFIGPIFSSIFLWGTWFIKGDVLTFKEGIHWYMVIAPIGSSLFLASLMVIAYDKIKKIINVNLKFFLLGLLFLTTIPVYLISSKEINETFGRLIKTGYKASNQEQMKGTLLRYLKDPLEKNPALFYFEATNQTYFPISLIVGFEEALHFRNWELVNGCIGLIKDRASLEKSIVVKGGVKGFNAASLCIKNSLEVSRPEVFYQPENFHAFRLQGKQVSYIKEEMLEELGFFQY